MNKFKVEYHKSSKGRNYDEIDFFYKNKYASGFVLEGCKDVITMQLMFLIVCFGNIVGSRNHINVYLYNKIF